MSRPFTKFVAFIACLGAAFGAGVCNADLTMHMHTTMDIPALRSSMPTMESTAQPMLDKMADSTLYMSGHKMRSESQLFTMISDQDAGKMWMLNPATKTYSTVAFNPDLMKKLLSSSPASGSPSLTENIIDTHRSTTILGHNAHHYIVRLKMNIMGHSMHMVQDILAATDIDASEVEAYGQMSNMSGKSVPGFPLMTSTSFTGDMPGINGMIMKQQVVSISTDPISPDVFAIPSGYTESASPGTAGH